MSSQSDTSVKASGQRRVLSRRELLRYSAAAAGSVATAAMLGACQVPPSPAAAPAATAIPAPTQVPVTSASKKLVIWARASFTTFADQFIANLFKEWGNANDTEVDYQVQPAPEWYTKIAAAIEGKTVPDILQVYEYETMGYVAENQIEDVSDIVNEIIGLEGGIFESALMTHRHEGKYYGVPTTVNPWLMHTRKDVLEAGGVEYPKSWDQMVADTAKLVKPPELYGIAQSMAETNMDCNSKFMTIAWAYGGQMQNEEGALMFKSPGTLEAIKIVKSMWDKKLIPEDALVWDSGGDNKAYQSGQVIYEFNPNSVYAFISTNDAELLAKTVMNRAIGGPAGSFDMVDVYGWGILKGAKNVEGAKAAIRYYAKPENYAKVIETGSNRWAPIYKNMMDKPMWQTDVYKNYKDLMTNGRVMSYAGPPNAAYAEAMKTSAIARMLGAVCSLGKDPEEAMNEAYDQMVAIYKKWNMPIA